MICFSVRSNRNIAAIGTQAQRGLPNGCPFLLLPEQNPLKNRHAEPCNNTYPRFGRFAKVFSGIEPERGLPRPAYGGDPVRSAIQANEVSQARPRGGLVSGVNSCCVATLAWAGHFSPRTKEDASFAIFVKANESLLVHDGRARYYADSCESSKIIRCRLRKRAFIFPNRVCHWRFSGLHAHDAL